MEHRNQEHPGSPAITAILESHFHDALRVAMDGAESIGMGESALFSFATHETILLDFAEDRLHEPGGRYTIYRPSVGFPGIELSYLDPPFDIAYYAHRLQKHASDKRTFEELDRESVEGAGEVFIISEDGRMISLIADEFIDPSGYASEIEKCRLVSQLPGWFVEAINPNS